MTLRKITVLFFIAKYFFYSHMTIRDGVQTSRFLEHKFPRARIKFTIVPPVVHTRKCNAMVDIR
jgi:hypothetical protein